MNAVFAETEEQRAILETVRRFVRDVVRPLASELDRRDEAVSWAERAYALDPDDPYLIYGIACFYAQLGDPDRALDHFENALKAGFAHKEWLEKDTDLDPIRDTDRFRELVRTLG